MRFRCMTAEIGLVSTLRSDRSGISVDSVVELRLFDSSGGVQEYFPGRVVPAGMYRLEFYYEGYRIYTGALAPSTNPSATLSVQLQMVPIGSTQGGYLALNATQTSITIVEQNSQRLTFMVEGDGPILVVAKVSKKPLYVERDGQRVFWSYNETSQTASVESATSGTFSMVMENTSWLGLPMTYLASIGIVTAIITGTATALFLRGKRHAKAQTRTQSSGKALQTAPSTAYSVPSG